MSQSERLFTFCVRSQSECVKFHNVNKKREKIAPSSKPGVPFVIRIFTPKMKNSESLCFFLKLYRGDFFNSF